MNLKQPVENADHALIIIDRLRTILRKPVVPAAVLLNEMSPNEQAVIVWFLARCKERQDANRAAMTPEMRQLMDELNGDA